jgi:hypothetical protein
VRRRGQWRIVYDVGAAHFEKYCTDEDLLRCLADRYGIVNEVTYIGPEVAETNALFDAWIEEGR